VSTEDHSNNFICIWPQTDNLYILLSIHQVYF